MNTRLLRWLLAGLGISALIVGIGMVASPGLASSVPIDVLLAIAGNDYVVIAAVGALTFIASVGALAGRTTTELDQAEMPDPEEVWGAPRMGAEFDNAIKDGSGFAGVFGETRESVRSRLTEAAIAVKMRRAGCGREAARQAIEEGDWTDDHVAATFLASESYSGPSLTNRLNARLRGSTWFAHAVHRTVAAVERAHEGDEGARV